jgi:hypothetical protein
VRPSLDDQHIRGQKLPVEGQPAEQFALRLRMSRPNILGVKPGMEAEELSVLIRASRELEGTTKDDNGCGWAHRLHAVL